MTIRHCFSVTIFALAALGAVMPRSASADIPTRSSPPTTQSTKPTLSDPGKKSIDSAGGSSTTGPSTGGASSDRYQKAPFEPATVCFSNCPSPQQSSGGQKPVDKLSPGGMPTGSSLTRRQ